MKNQTSLPYWAIIPAAGVGSRMQTQTPKQYLSIAGKTILEHTLSIFIQHPLINGVVISISENDTYWPEVHTSILKNTQKKILVANGGKERSDSVLSALQLLQQHIQTDAWSFVHDAARPCLLTSDIDKLITNLNDAEDGILLGLPISDTLKRSNSQQQVETTINRDFMWRALTPQVFKLLTLIQALTSAQSQQATITDESSAIERLGLKPTLVEGNIHNIKITHPNDLIQAENFLALKNVI